MIAGLIIPRNRFTSRRSRLASANHKPQKLLNMLSISDHSRDSAGMKYVYPVIFQTRSWRFGKHQPERQQCLQLGVCLLPGPQPETRRPAPIDLAQLEDELRHFLRDATTGDFLEKNAPPEARRLVDIAFSGNGRNSQRSEFAETVDCAERVLREYDLLNLKLRLITNGSLMHRPQVQQGIARIGQLDGEVWFKIDRASETGIEQINGIRLTPEKIREALIQCAELAPTWIQTCYFAFDAMRPMHQSNLPTLNSLFRSRKK